MELCVTWTVSLLIDKFPHKAQVAQQQVVCLGYEITAGLWTLGAVRNEAICQTPEPRMAKE